MASPAYETILAIQALDVAVTQLRHRLATHPAHQELASARAGRDEVAAAIAELDERSHQLERDEKRLADEVAGIEDKRTEVDGKLYGGAVTASKELLALQEEAAALLERQRGLEDRELEIMETQEGLAEARVERQRELAAWDEAIARANEALAETEAEVEAEIERIGPERAGAAASVPPELLARYEELAEQFGGVAVARLVEGRCDGCHMLLSAVARDRLGKAPEDAVVTCEECGRLLVR